MSQDLWKHSIGQRHGPREGKHLGSFLVAVAIVDFSAFGRGTTRSHDDPFRSWRSIWDDYQPLRAKALKHGMTQSIEACLLVLHESHLQ